MGVSRRHTGCKLIVHQLIVSDYHWLFKLIFDDCTIHLIICTKRLVFFFVKLIFNLRGCPNTLSIDPRHSLLLLEHLFLLILSLQVLLLFQCFLLSHFLADSIPLLLRLNLCLLFDFKLSDLGRYDLMLIFLFFNVFVNRDHLKTVLLNCFVTFLDQIF